MREKENDEHEKENGEHEKEKRRIACRRKASSFEANSNTIVTAMATFRSESNSVPNTTRSDRLTALREKLTTCFQQWRQQLLKSSSHPHPQKQRGAGGQFYTIFLRAECSAVGEKVTYFRKFRKIFTARKEAAAARAPEAQFVEKQLEQVQEQEQELQIVATLFSSTLISKYNSKSSNSGSSGNDMTIMEDTYMGVRDEYPDIDTEIRAILMANAQNGITISSIKSKYSTLAKNIPQLKN